MSFFDNLPNNFKKNAYCAGQEVAWSDGDAVKVIDYLTKKDVPIARIEVWLPTNPGPTIPTPFIYTWESQEKKDNENFEHFVQRVNNQAKNYIQKFRWDKNDLEYRVCIPYFNLDTY